MSIKPSNFLYFPVNERGQWLRDSQGKPRVYRSATGAFRNLKEKEYVAIQIYAVDDILSREEFEKAVLREKGGE